MTGFKSPYVPGWDCHGLPTESAIIKQTKLDRSKLTIPEFRNKCRDFASGYVDIQREQFKRLGVLGDWENPYLTLKPEFEAKQIEIFGEMAKKGYIYRGFKSVYWCPNEPRAKPRSIQRRQMDSIYVKFRSNDNAIGISNCPQYFVIWNHPWTIGPVICISSRRIRFVYEGTSGDIYIVAEQLAQNLRKAAEIEDYEILGKLKGSEFELMTARHPFLDRTSVILNGDHVTAEAGTGCVHTAPGHGSEDFDICKKYDDEGRTSIGVIVPVDAKGCMTADAGKYEGLPYYKANKAIYDDMKK